MTDNNVVDRLRPVIERAIKEAIVGTDHVSGACDTIIPAGVALTAGVLTHFVERPE